MTPLVRVAKHEHSKHQEKWLHITTTLLKDKKRHSIIHYMVMHYMLR